MGFGETIVQKSSWRKEARMLLNIATCQWSVLLQHFLSFWKFLMKIRDLSPLIFNILYERGCSVVSRFLRLLELSKPKRVDQNMPLRKQSAILHSSDFINSQEKVWLSSAVQCEGKWKKLLDTIVNDTKRDYYLQFRDKTFEAKIPLIIIFLPHSRNLPGSALWKDSSFLSARSKNRKLYRKELISLTCESNSLKADHSDCKEDVKDYTETKLKILEGHETRESVCNESKISKVCLVESEGGDNIYVHYQKCKVALNEPSTDCLIEPCLNEVDIRNAISNAVHQLPSGRTAHAAVNTGTPVNQHVIPSLQKKKKQTQRVGRVSSSLDEFERAVNLNTQFPAREHVESQGELAVYVLNRGDVESRAVSDGSLEHDGHTKAPTIAASLAEPHNHCNKDAVPTNTVAFGAESETRSVETTETQQAEYEQVTTTQSPATKAGSNTRQSNHYTTPDFTKIDGVLEDMARGNEVGPKTSMKHQLLRLCTLRNYPKDNKPSLIKLAAAGFYYAADGDEVVCYCCGIRRRHWTAQCDPMEIHKRLSPRCAFLTRNEEVNFPVPSEGTHEENVRMNEKFANLQELLVPLPAEVGYDVPIAAPAKHSSPGTSTNTNIAVYDKSPKHPHYAVKQVRLNSYDGWPADAQQTAEVLAEAGFYYAGMGDCVRCYHCGVGLRHWAAEDNPWIEHGRWTLDNPCYYLIQVKGEEFLSLIRMAVEITDTQPRLPGQSEGSTGNSSNQNSKGSNSDNAQAGKNTGSKQSNKKGKPNEEKKQLKEENEMLRKQALCKVCEERDVCIVFLPCGHLITCAECAPTLSICSTCKAVVKGTVKTYMS